MKITQISTYPVDFPQEPAWAYSKGWVTSAPALLIEINTDEGVSGLGEAYGPPRAVEALIRDFCEPSVIGTDPFQTEELWGRLVHDARDFGTPGPAMAAISAIDIACWDIKGKALGVPVCTLLGGAVQSELNCYASGLRYLRDADGADGFADPVPMAERFVEEGFGSIKMSVGLLDLRDDLGRVRRVKESLPPGVALMVDANHAYTSRVAKEFGAAMEDLGIAWFEDALPPDDLPGYESLREAVGLPLAGGESLLGRAGFRDFLIRRVFDVAIPETGLAGGLTECKKIADLAWTFGVECTPHGYASVVGTAAAIHLAASLPPQPPSGSAKPLPFEWAPEPFSRLGGLAADGFDFDHGKIRVPLHRPGLGVELDRAALKKRLMTA
jgi:D-galactarolactone cycloisomerase